MRWLLRTCAAVLLFAFFAAPAMADETLPPGGTLTWGDGSNIYVTGYTCPPYCDPTAVGLPVGPGSAACPPWWAFGTKISIQGVGVVTCTDLYDPDLGEHIDVFEPDDESCYEITGWHPYTPVLPVVNSGHSSAA